MKTQVLDSPAKRISIAVAIVTGLILLAAIVFTFLGGSSSLPANGPKIIAAARDYGRALKQAHSPIPQSVPLQTLIDQGLLQPADVGSFQGLDANISLTSSSDSAHTILMRVHMPDGLDLVLLGDGSAQEVPSPKR
jgi:hypothetical protein